MTAPTQPPDPRVQRIARELEYYESRPFTGDRYTTFARVLVEELGGREGQKTDTFPVKIDMHGRKIALGEDTYADGSPCFVATAIGTDVSAYARTVAEAFRLLDMAMRAHESVDSAQQRENADTIKALKERAETAEAANTELDNARKSAEQSARDLRENNATLRAELDAIKGAQQPVISIVCKDNVCQFGGSSFPSMLADGVHMLYLHPAPALSVVGACVVRDNGAIGTYTLLSFRGQVECEDNALIDAKHGGGKAYRLYRDVTPLPTEGGK